MPMPMHVYMDLPWPELVRTAASNAGPHTTWQDRCSVWTWVLSAWQDPAPVPLSPEEMEARRAAGTAANAASIMHGLDLRSRQLLSQAVSACPQVRLRCRALPELPCF